jgi:myo-inositol catabolism protein IolC
MPHRSRCVADLRSAAASSAAGARLDAGRLDDAAVVAQVAERYSRLIGMWRDLRP